MQIFVVIRIIKKKIDENLKKRSCIWKLPENEDIYSHLNMKTITDADYTHRKIVCKNFRKM